MDYSHLDLSRFRKITREEYYTTEWEFSDEEAKFARELDDLTPYARHNRCHKFANTKDDREASEVWNLWACVYRERYLIDAEAREQEIYNTGKKINPINEGFYIDFSEGLSISKVGKYNIRHLDLSNFVIPYVVSFSKMTFSTSSNFVRSLFLAAAHFGNSEFLGEVSFEGAVFSDSSHFSEITFKLKAIFDATLFVGNTYFERTNFSDQSNFFRTQFYKEVSFTGTVFGKITTFFRCSFSERATFETTTFSKGAVISEVTFAKLAKFNNSNFIGEINFDESIFGRRSTFQKSTFNGPISFRSTRFNGVANFNSATFLDAVSFVYCIFSQGGSFEQSQFEAATNFNYSQFGASKSLPFIHKIYATLIWIMLKTKNSDIKRYSDTVPDFSNTTFTKSPYVSSIELNTNEVMGRVEATNRIRILKKMAIDNKNNFAEAELFRYELLSRCGSEIFGIQAYAIRIYNFFSKCGLSFVRPVISLLVTILLFWSIYIILYDNLNIRSIYSGNSIDLFRYSAHNAIFPFIGASASEKIVVINSLFGGYENRPWQFEVVSFIQNIICLSLEFLILLAIRNFFRMR